MKKTTFALYFGNRGFMPAELLSSARQEMIEAVENAGYDYLIMDEKATRYGAVETREEGRIYAKWLEEHRENSMELYYVCPFLLMKMGPLLHWRMQEFQF